MRNKTSILEVMARTFAYMFQAAPIVFVTFLVSALFFAVEQLVEVIVIQHLFDTVAASLNDTTYREALKYIIIAGVIFLLGPVLGSILDVVQGYLYRRTDGFLQSKIYQKIAQVNLEHFERSETFDDVQKAVDGSSEIPAVCRDVLYVITNYIPFLIMMAIYFWSIKPILCIVVLAIFLPVFLSERMRSSAFYRLEVETVNTRRHSDYYAETIISRQFFKETRTSGATGFFFSLYRTYLNDYIKQLWKTQKKVSTVDFLLGSVNILGYTSVLALLVYYLIKGEISIGIFSAVYFSIAKLYSTSQRMLRDIGSIMKNIATGSFLFDFLKQEFASGIRETPEKTQTIELRNVSFQYPGATNLTLKNINLVIHPGETIALVGENGAGKTTLTKILLGLLHPTEGRITVGGNDLSNYSINTVYGASSAVFQNYQRYQMTLGDNILISDSQSSKDPVSTMVRAGIDLSSGLYPNHTQTMLSREFGGIDLSGGQWQRIAIARGIFRESDFIVLDEPTAAIDPLEETRIFDQFTETVYGKTAVLVSHRLGSTKIADRIIVLEQGEMIESGTHSELMETGGRYSEMFALQAEWYR
jgi:ATP-binding cassette subfamily B protein